MLQEGRQQRHRRQQDDADDENEDEADGEIPVEKQMPVDERAGDASNMCASEHVERQGGDEAPRSRSRSI